MFYFQHFQGLRVRSFSFAICGKARSLVLTTLEFFYDCPNNLDVNIMESVWFPCRFYPIPKCNIYRLDIFDYFPEDLWDPDSSRSVNLGSDPVRTLLVLDDSVWASCRNLVTVVDICSLNTQVRKSLSGASLLFYSYKNRDTMWLCGMFELFVSFWGCFAPSGTNWVFWICAAS